MPRRCTICSHPDRLTLERRLVAGEAMAKIAREARPTVTARAIRHHRDEHLADHLAAGHADELLAGADELLADLDLLRRATMSILAGALHGELDPPGHDGPGRPPLMLPTAEGRWALPDLALRAVRECRATLELCARVAGELDSPGADGTVTVVFTDDWDSVE